jgi:gamma-glutamylaminecyclotransferase
LVVAGKWLSPILIAEPGVGHRVFGEVFEVNEQALAELDDLEGTHLPIGYHRLMISVENVDGGAVLDAWTYVKDRSRIDVIHSDPLEEYHLDPRYVPASEREA